MELNHPLDPWIAAADRALRALFAPAHASRPVPGDSTAPMGPTSDVNPPSSTEVGNPATPAGPAALESDRRRSAGLMRVNHSGEIAAQALYHGQALLAGSASSRELLLRAAGEESDHLGWCETRLRELGARPSVLNPVWYGGSFLIGALAALLGDRVSLGFVVETERQVEGHLDEHLARLPPSDGRSRAILQAMRTDEIAHGATAQAAGAAALPAIVRTGMRRTARIMTSVAYWI